jgi:hypothetical protein
VFAIGRGCGTVCATHLGVAQVQSDEQADDGDGGKSGT